MRFLFIPIATALLTSAGAAEAHPKLLSASPAPNATVAKPARVELHFSEKLMSKFTGGDLTMTGGAEHVAMKVASAAAVGTDGHTLIVTPKSPMGAGRYTIAWHAVSVDTHRVTGSYAFVVK